MKQTKIVVVLLLMLTWSVIRKYCLSSYVGSVLYFTQCKLKWIIYFTLYAQVTESSHQASWAMFWLPNESASLQDLQGFLQLTVSQQLSVLIASATLWWSLLHGPCPQQRQYFGHCPQQRTCHCHSPEGKLLHLQAPGASCTATCCLHPGCWQWMLGSHCSLHSTCE